MGSSTRNKVRSLLYAHRSAAEAHTRAAAARGTSKYDELMRNAMRDTTHVRGASTRLGIPFSV